MLKIILILLALAIGAVLVLAAMKPDTFSVQRSISIKAPPEKVFAVINDFKAWADWSPWEKKDPAMKRTFGASTSGKGATYAWEGNKEVGKGSMEIAESTPPSKILINLNFISPFEAHNTAEFLVQAQGDTTNVVWTMRGPSPFPAKIMQVFCNMDQMVGKDFEAGLASMKALAEK